VVIGHYNRMSRLVNHWREQARKISEYQPITTENFYKSKFLKECADQLDAALVAEKIEALNA